MACLDSNVLLRFALKDVPDHYVRAKALLARTDLIFDVADSVWVEIAYALDHHYGLDRSAIADVITSLASIPSIKVDMNIIDSTCRSYVSHPKLSFVDCYLATRASLPGISPLYTFDEKFARQHDCAELVPLYP